MDQVLITGKVLNGKVIKIIVRINNLLMDKKKK